jgi:fermentation-respiration switch protein FrsA (DUF1100 family)
MTLPQPPMDAAATPSVRKARRWRLLARWLGLLGLAYLGVCVVIFALQNWMLFPGHSTQGTPDATVRPFGSTEVVHLKSAIGDDIAMLYAPALSPDGTAHPDAIHRPTILFFYGNGMCMAYTLDIVRRLQRMGVNVAVPDYAGFGMSSGSPSETSLYATADAAYDHVVQARNADPARVVPMGWSLGAGVAVDLASRKPVGALVTISAFTSVPDMARKMLPWLPTSLLVRHRFDNESKIATIDLPTLIIHGRQDSIIPHWMSDRLAAAAKGRPVNRWSLDADHNDVFDTDPELYRVLGEFLDRVSESDSSSQ